MRELVLITGGGCDVGQATAIACAQAGFQSILTVRRVTALPALERAKRELGLDIEVEQLDVTAPRVGAKVRELVLKYGPFYGLVNNATVVHTGPFEEQPESEVWEQFETNVLGLMAVTRALLPSMRACDRGRIVNVSSLAGQLALPGMSTYSAAAHAVEGFSEALRLEIAPFGLDVCMVVAGTARPAGLLNIITSATPGAPTGPYGSMMAAAARAVEQAADKEPSPDAVALAIAKLFKDPSPPHRTVVGLNARTMAALRRLIPDSLFADGIRRYIGLPAPPGRSR